MQARVDVPRSSVAVAVLRTRRELRTVRRAWWRGVATASQVVEVQRRLARIASTAA